jgi:hypothetical protein
MLFVLLLLPGHAEPQAGEAYASPVLDRVQADSEAYRFQPVYEIYHDLLQQGVYLGSLSTWYRQLREAKESGDRRPQRSPQHHAMPRITARAANEA